MRRIVIEWDTTFLVQIIVNTVTAVVSNNIRTTIGDCFNTKLTLDKKWNIWFTPIMQLGSDKDLFSWQTQPMYETLKNQSLSPAPVPTYEEPSAPTQVRLCW